MKDIRPYMFWAHIQWLDESGVTPHIAIQNGPKTMFPPSLQSHSVVTFNVSAEAVNGLNLDEHGLSFSARFGGREFKVFAPLDCLLQLHSKDGQVRIGLQAPTGEQQPHPGPRPEPVEEVSPEPVRQKPQLTVIAGSESDGIKRGKLSLVPKTDVVEEPFEPEQA
jgi:stringent starvation protein B